MLKFCKRAFSIFGPSVTDEDGHLFAVMYALMESEKADDAIRFVLGALVQFCPEVVSEKIIRTVFSDKGLSEAIVHDVFGADVNSLLCLFHQGLNFNHNLGKQPKFIEVVVGSLM